MMNDGTNLQALATGPARRQVIAGVAMALFGGLTLGSSKSWAAAEEEISHTAEAIHQEQPEARLRSAYRCQAIRQGH
jgi:hypothetical protein